MRKLIERSVYDFNYRLPGGWLKAKTGAGWGGSGGGSKGTTNW